MLGDDGREALHGCVKVQTFRLPERHEYNRETALERLKRCYGGRFPLGFETWCFFDPLALFDIRSGHNVSKMKRTYDIVTIREALLTFDEVSYVAKYPSEGPECEKMKEIIDQRRADVNREFDEANAKPDGRHKYSWLVAQRRVRDCFAGNFAGDAGLLDFKVGRRYTITDIYNAFKDIDSTGRLLKYPEGNGPGSDELKALIVENRENLCKEYLEPTEKSFQRREYSRTEAERRLRDCFAGTLPKDTDIFPSKRNQNEFPYDIFDIKLAIYRFDNKKLIDKYPEPRLQGHDEKRQKVDDERARIETEYEQAINMTEIEHGSGFIILDGGSIITNKHVIETYLHDEKKCTEIYISNEVIDGLPCTVADVDDVNDLAFLYCSMLENHSEIPPLRLSDEPLREGFEVFCYGYPIHYTGKKALLARGMVSGFKDIWNRDSLVVLNCSLSPGNSGGPVLRRKKDQLVVVGVVKEKHKKDVFNEDELDEMLKDSMERDTTCDVQDATKTFSHDLSQEMAQMSIKIINTKRLVYKLNDALATTHSPYNYSNAIQGKVVTKFVEDVSRKMEKNEDKLY